MSLSDILSQITSLSMSIQQLLSFLDSKKTGLTTHSPDGRVSHELNLNKNDFDRIFQDLTEMGQSVQKLTQDFRKASKRSDVHDNTQSLVDGHAMSLTTITAILQGQIPQSDYGDLLHPLQGLNSAIMNLQQTAIVLNSYSPPHSATPTNTAPLKTRNIKSIAAVIAVIILIAGGGGTAYHFSVNIEDNSNNEQIINNIDSPGSEIETGPNIDIENSPNANVNIYPGIDVEGDAVFNYNSPQITSGLSIVIIPHVNELTVSSYPAIIFPNGTVIYKEGTVTSDGYVLYENELAKFTIFVYNGGSKIEKLDKYVLKIIPDDESVQPITRYGNFDDVILVPESEPYQINVEFEVTDKLIPSGIIKFEVHHGKGKIESEPLKYEIHKNNPFKP